MEIKYNGKTFYKIKHLLAETTIANLDKFLFDNKKITLSDFIDLQEQENCKDAKGSALNSGDRGSASNSGDWGISVSNSFLGKVTNKANCFSFITEPIFDKNGTIISQNAQIIKFTKNMEGKFYTLLKNTVLQVVEYDGIEMAILQKNNKKGYKIYQGIVLDNFSIYRKSLSLDDLKKVYVVEKNNIYSHGETIKQAIEDLRYKISNRDLSEFEYFKTCKKEISSDEIIKGYRVITGACEFGTKNFVEGLGKIKSKYTIDEALKILEEYNAYALDKFKEFIRGRK